MARWRTHRRRADKKRRMPYARFKVLRKSARYGALYGMGVRKLSDYLRTDEFQARQFRDRVVMARITDFTKIEARVLAHYRNEE